MHPIWKDYYVDLGEVDSSKYYIDRDGETIHIGIAYRRPDEYNCRVKINDICGSHIPRMALASGEEFFPYLLSTFNIFNSEGVDVFEKFFNDWSY